MHAASKTGTSRRQGRQAEVDQLDWRIRFFRGKDEVLGLHIPAEPKQNPSASPMMSAPAHMWVRAHLVQDVPMCHS
jgi:hypothetical protein